MTEKKAIKAVETGFSEIRSIIARLRGPGGCPWDRKQTPSTVRKYILEEAYEVAEAIEEGRDDEVCEELGDLFFMLLFVTAMYEEENMFSLDKVLRKSAQKMIRRHPHIFSDVRATSSEDVIRNWQAIKASESRKKGRPPSVLGDLPKALPALQRAFRIGERASRTGFDWPSVHEVWDKMTEEEQELREAIQSQDKKAVEREIGDLLFTAANLSRLLGVNPEEALRQTAERFTRRFRAMEKLIGSKGKELPECSLEEMNTAWEQVKKTTEKI